MSYLVLARKYRPQTFDGLVGQGAIAKTLKNAIAEGRLAHAFLFTGSRGVGKTSTARILAKGLNCDRGPTPEPCGVCESCREIAQGTSVNVFEIDGASNTSVDDVRALRETLQYLPPKGKFKVYVIDEVHMLSTSAFNALLKTLEEPPDHVLFIFATTEPHKIPETILSRCQRYDFKRIGVSEIAAELRRIVAAEGLEVDEAAILTLAREAAGGMRDALSLLDQVVAFAGGRVGYEQLIEVLGLVDRRLLYDISRAVRDRDPAGALALVDQVYDRGYDLRNLTKDFLEHLRDLVVAKVGAERVLDLPESEIADLRALAEGATLSDLQMAFALFRRGAEDILRAEEPRMVLEMELVKLATAERVIDLDRLEQMLAGGAVPAGQSAGARQASARPTSSGRPAPRDAGGAAPAAGPRSWAGFLADLGKTDPALRAILDHAALLGEDDGALDLGFDPEAGAFPLAHFEKAANLRKLEEYAARYYGSPRSVRVRATGAGDRPVARSQADERRDARAEQARAHEGRVRSHAVFEAMTETFPEGRATIAPPGDDDA